MRLAVVGHIEYAEILRTDRLPGPGGLIEASSLRTEFAGAGAGAARQLAALDGACSFFTVLADSELGGQSRVALEREGVQVHAVVHPGTVQRRAFVQVDAAAQRAITVHGPKLCPSGRDRLPWDELAGCDGVCFVCGDGDALEAARRARVLVATARWLPVLKRSGVRLDALVSSRDDPDETYAVGELDPPPRLTVTTAGAAGGSYRIGGGSPRRFRAAPLDGKPVDSYGAGDSFIAGLTYALSRGDRPGEAIRFAARCGAAVLTADGLSDQLRLADVRAPTPTTSRRAAP